MAAGVAGALAMPTVINWALHHGYISDSLPLYWWPVLFVLSIAGCLAGTYAAPPTEMTVLKSFYTTVRPWGFWKRVHDEVVSENPRFEPNKRFKLDMFNVLLGIIAQCCLTILPMYVVLWMKLPLLITVVVLMIIILVLKKTWWDKLEN